MEGTGEGNDFLGWLSLPTYEETEEMRRIAQAAARIRESSEAFVVVGIGGSYLGPRAAIELLYGGNYNLQRGTKGNPRIFFAGNGLSTRAWNDLSAELDGKDFSVVFISKSRHHDGACHCHAGPALDAGAEIWHRRRQEPDLCHY